MSEELVPLSKDFPPSLTKGTGEQGVAESISGSLDLRGQSRLCVERRQLFLCKRDKIRSWICLALNNSSAFP